MSRPRIRLSAAVMAHPARRAQAERLRERHPELDLTVVVDPRPGTEGGALRTARLAWDAVAPDATHHLVVQDDTVLCPSFRKHLRHLVTARPTEALSLYAEWGFETSYAARLAALLGSPWADPIDDFVPTQALVLPAAAARGFSRFTGYVGRHDDVAMREYLADLGVAVRVAVPNLVDDAQLPSIVGHDYQGERASVCYLPGELDRVDWRAAPAEPATIPVFSWTIGQAYTMVRPTAARSRWRRTSHPVLCARTPTPAAAREQGRAAVPRWPALARVVGPRPLLGLWQTAFGLGLVAAGRSVPDEVLTRPAVRAALATMPRGAFRFLVDDHRLREHLPDLCRLVETGVREGLVAGAGHPSHPMAAAAGGRSLQEEAP